ncbi:putative RDD family membrane protein YckC [Evansella vedderi]|uniref:RDD family membrane protein YckC n=1 Tax=Evansella vedderi TaxID=38282 RepID=A0ABU0A0L9_9BACI|nr:RDD family protein [Evansella vedderi]MDQ0257041.1 putative RDD family membrane protein YckC [Evansella vedderi]
MVNNIYAGFLRRFFAFFVDTLFILYPLNLLNHLVLGLGEKQETIWFNIPILVIWSLYRIILPTTKLQGTIGKAIFGMKIIDHKGNQLTLAKSVGRYLGEFLSLVFFIGYLMIAFTERKTGLHDRLANTYVVYKQNVLHS